MKEKNILDKQKDKSLAELEESKLKNQKLENEVTTSSLLFCLLAPEL